MASRSWGAPELREVHSRARELALALNRPRALLFSLWRQWIYHAAQADLRRARQLVDEMVAVGEASGDVATRVMGYEAGGYTYFQLGAFTTSGACVENGLALYDPAHRSFYAELVPHDVRVFLRTHSSWLLACLGHLDQALCQRDAALEEARGLSHPATLAYALGPAAWGSGLFIGLEPATLLQYADETLALATAHGLGLFRAAALIYRGWCLAALGRAHEGIPLLTAGVAGLDQLGFMAFRPLYLSLLADACRMGAQRQAALHHAGTARRLAGETEARWYQAETLRITGDVRAAMGDRAGAEAGYNEAIAIAQQQSAKLWELRAATGLAKLWRDQGKRSEAHELLAPVYNWFTEGIGTPVLQDAKALLAELAA